MAKKAAPKKRSRKRVSSKSAFPEKQLEMPAGFHADGSTLATLKDVLDPDKATMQLSDLSLHKRAELVAERLSRQPGFELAMVGAGMVDKARAITEVKNRTKVGRLLIEIEHQMIKNLMEQAQKKASGPGKSSGSKPK
jgi:hypothetical protein